MRVGGIGETTALLPTEGTIGVESSPSAGAGEGPAGASFGDVFAGMIKQANEADHAATVKVDALSSGATDDLHGTMIATREADISIKLVGTIRNKLLDAFQEIWKTSV